MVEVSKRMGPSAHKPDDRGARNQAIFRAVNGKIVELTERFGDEVKALEIACECADATCTQLLEINAEAYAVIRRSPRTFVVLTDHVRAGVERVVGRHDGYSVVEPIAPSLVLDVSDAAGGACGR